MNSPMILVVDVDWSTLECPCGDSLCGQYCREGEWEKFKEEHRSHTNGCMQEHWTTRALNFCEPGSTEYKF